MLAGALSTAFFVVLGVISVILAKADHLMENSKDGDTRGKNPE